MTGTKMTPAGCIDKIGSYFSGPRIPRPREGAIAGIADLDSIGRCKVEASADETMCVISVVPNLAFNVKRQELLADLEAINDWPQLIDEADRRWMRFSLVSEAENPSHICILGAFFTDTAGKRIEDFFRFACMGFAWILAPSEENN